MFQGTCKFYLEGGCKFGDKCKFKHQKTKQQIPCEFYKRGICKYGNKCQRYHQKSGYQLKSYVARHGQSNFNHRLEQFAKKNENIHSEEAQQFQFDETLIDSGLTQLGVQQSMKARLDYQKHEIELVFVSPLNRALETCDIIFSGRSIPVIVVPQFTQVLSMVCDVSKPIIDKRKKYQYMNFDMFEDFDIDWQTSQISMHHNIKFGAMGAYQITNELFSLMKKKFPQRLEGDSECRGRILRGVGKIKKVCEQRGVRNVAIIAHRRVIRELSKSYNQKIGVGLQNAEILELDL